MASAQAQITNAASDVKRCSPHYTPGIEGQHFLSNSAAADLVILYVSSTNCFTYYYQPTVNVIWFES